MAKTKIKKKPQQRYDILTLEEAAEFLRIAPESLLAEAEAGRVPGLCFVGEWRFSSSALVAALYSGNGKVPEQTDSVPKRIYKSFSKVGEPMTPEEVAYWASRRPLPGAGSFEEDPEDFIAEIMGYRATHRMEG